MPRLDPHELARAIADAYPQAIPPSTLRQLAVALGNGGGLAHDVNINRFYAVLRDPFAAEHGEDGVFRPTLVIVDRPNKANRGPRACVQVAEFFYERLPFDIGAQPERNFSRAPVIPDQSEARVVIGGPTIAGPDYTSKASDDFTTVGWYRISQVPAGSFVYYVDPDGAGTLYQRLSPNPDHWGVGHFDGTADIVDLAGVLHEVLGVHGDTVIEGLDHIEGDSVLLQPVPTVRKRRSVRQQRRWKAGGGDAAE